MADNSETLTRPLLGDTSKLRATTKDGVRTCSVGGLLVMLAYLASAAYYFYVRINFTLDVGWMWYAYSFLVLELMGCASIIAYASILTRRVTKRKSDESEIIRNDYVLRVMVPCYKEDLEIIRHTVMAAIEAELPANCTKHVYLCDDGRDPEKMTWCEEVNRRWNEGTLHYCRRPKSKGELNGKACNLNYTLRKIYGSSAARDGRVASHGRQPSEYSNDMLDGNGTAVEAIAVFDADMVCKPKFFMKTLPILDTCDMVLTPQWFYNVPMMADIFNHSNLHLWEYMLPAMDGWGCLSCTGTNFVIRAEAMVGAGYFPEYTVTEDYALSLELGRHGYNTRYLNEYLAEGEAPEEIPNIFKQRHRWCTGHIQVFFGKRNPLFYSHLPLRMRFMYSMGAYSYACAAFLTPMFLLAPVVAIWFGVFPIDLNVRYPLAFTIYYGMTLVTVYYSRSLKHLIFLWFASNANLVLWYTYQRAIINVLISFVSCGANKIKFEVTDKAGPSLRNGTLTSSLSTGSLAATESIKVETDPGSRRRVMSCGSLADFGDNQGSDDSADFPSESDDEGRKQHISIPIASPVQVEKVPLLPVSEKAPRHCCACVSSLYTFIANLWVPIVTLLLCLGSIAAGLWLGLENHHTYHIQMVSIIWCGYNAIAPFLVLYYAFFQFRGLKTVCCSMAAFSILLLAAVLCSLHFYYRDVYNYKEVINMSLMFYEAQRSGSLPSTNRINWRGDSALHDVTPNNQSLVGGYYDAGDTVKFGFPAAVSMSFLAWGLIEFKDSFRNAGQEEYLKDTLKWGTDFFLKAHYDDNKFIAQVGDADVEHGFWERPEDYLRDKRRVGFEVNEEKSGSDIVGSTAAALAASSMVFRDSHPKYSNKLLKHAKQLYDFGNKFRGLYSDSVPQAKEYYESTSYEDDLAWAALWIYEATSDDSYLGYAEDHIKNLYEEFKNDPLSTTDWDNLLNPVMLMLASIKVGQEEHQKYEDYVDKLLWKWMDDFTYTPKKLAYPATDWGVLRETANTAFIAMLHAKNLKRNQAEAAKFGGYECWAMFQIRYMLGEGGQSYVVGFGNNPPTHAHHQGASCPVSGPCGWSYFSDSDPNPNVIYGALVGGPDRHDHFDDTRSDYKHTEVTLDYNAGFTGALAGVVDMDGFGKCYWGGGIFKFFKSIDL